MPNLKRAGEAIAPKVKGKKAGDGDSDRDIDDGDMDSMTSGNGVDSTRVNAALLAGESQHTLSCTKHVWYSEHGTYY